MVLDPLLLQLLHQAADVTAASGAAFVLVQHPGLEARPVEAVATWCVDGSGAEAGQGITAADAALHQVGIRAVAGLPGTFFGG